MPNGRRSTPWSSRSARPSAEPAAEPCGGGTAFLVEDNPDVAEVTTSLLEELGYRVQLAGDASAALAAAEGRHFDLLLSDIVMPGEMDGLALAHTLRQRHPQLPILLVTGYSDSVASADEGFTMLRKPYRLADLNRAVAKAVAEAGNPAPANLIHLRRARRRREPGGERA